MFLILQNYAGAFSVFWKFLERMMLHRCVHGYKLYFKIILT